MDSFKKIAIFGASGATGRALTTHALYHQLDVNAYLRHQAAQPLDPGARLFYGSNDDVDEMADCITNCDAVFLTFGAHPPYAEAFCHGFTEKILKAMHYTACRRLIAITGATIGYYPKQRSVFFNLLSKQYARSQRDISQDRLEQEASIKQSHLDWTLIKTPRLTGGPTTRFVSGEHIKIGALSSLSRATLAEQLLDIAHNDDTIGQTIFIKKT